MRVLLFILVLTAFSNMVRASETVSTVNQECIEEVMNDSSVDMDESEAIEACKSGY